MLNAKDFYVRDTLLAVLRGEQGSCIDGVIVNRFGASISLEKLPNLFDDGFLSRYRARKVLKAMRAEGVLVLRNQRYYLVEKV